MKRFLLAAIVAALFLAVIIRLSMFAHVRWLTLDLLLPVRW